MIGRLARGLLQDPGLASTRPRSVRPTFVAWKEDGEWKTKSAKPRLSARGLVLGLAMCTSARLDAAGCRTSGKRGCWWCTISEVSTRQMSSAKRHPTLLRNPSSPSPAFLSILLIEGWTAIATKPGSVSACAIVMDDPRMTPTGRIWNTTLKLLSPQLVQELSWLNLSIRPWGAVHPSSFNCH